MIYSRYICCRIYVTLMSQKVCFGVTAACRIRFDRVKTHTVTVLRGVYEHIRTETDLTKDCA